jgi:hypothetical protein
MSPSDRNSYLDVASGADKELRAEVESPLASHEAAGSQCSPLPRPRFWTLRLPAMRPNAPKKENGSGAEPPNTTVS